MHTDLGKLADSKLGLVWSGVSQLRLFHMLDMPMKSHLTKAKFPTKEQLVKQKGQIRMY